MSHTAYINIAFQAFGGILSLMIILFLLFVKRNKSRLDHLYIRFLICNTLVLFTNAFSWVLDGRTGVGMQYATGIANFFMFVFSYLLIGFFSSYLSGYLAQRGTKCERAIRIVWVVCILLILLLIVLQWNQLYYFIDSKNVYHRRSMFWLSQAGALVSILPNFWIILRNRKMLRTKEMVLFLSYLIVPFAAIIVQMFTYGVVYLYLATTFVAICIYIFIQAEQAFELEHSRTAVMLSQIQPHFLYNSLLGIKLLCDTDPPRASEALEHFSFYLRGNLDSLVNTQLVSFEKELVHIRDYLFLEKMRFSDELNIHWDLQCGDFMLPPLTVQPLIENAIRHGLNKKTGGGTLTVKSERMDKNVVITIQDDGVGFDPSLQKEDGRTHIGIENTRSRLATLCGGSLLIESEKNVGTTAKIILPQRG